MKRKFKHYATDEILEFEVKNSMVEISGDVHKLVEFNDGVRANRTSWVIYND